MRNDALLHARMSGLSCCARPGALSALLFGSMGLAQSLNESAFYARSGARLLFFRTIPDAAVRAWRLAALQLSNESDPSSSPPSLPLPSHDDDADDDDDDHCGDHDDLDDGGGDHDVDDDDDDHRTP